MLDASDDKWEKFVYRPRVDQPFEADRCFLCGALLTPANRTDEHVFPQWLLREFDLWNAEMTLLNGTFMRYSALRIPCCSRCNNEHLSALEASVAEAFRSGPDAVAALDEDTLFLWMGKIYYGLMFRELFLAQDRRDPAAGTIMVEDVLSEFSMHHMLLQAARGAVRWTAVHGPASIFVFRCQEPTAKQARFDYFDMTNFPYLAIRAGSTAVIAVLQDWGALRGAVTVPAFEVAAQLELHPQQFRELAALGAYMTTLFNRVPKHMLAAAEDHVEVLTLPLGGLSSKFVFDEFHLPTYASVLAALWNQPVEEIFDGSRVVSLVRRGDDEAWTVPWSADEWVPVGIGQAGEGGRAPAGDAVRPDPSV